MLDTIVAPAPRPLVDRVLAAVANFFGAGDCAAARRRQAARDADEALIEGAAALDGFTGPSNWLGWAGFGMDHIEQIDWRPEAVGDERAEAADAPSARRSAFGD